MDNIRKLAKKSKYINHVNFSGMNFKKKEIFELIEILKSCHFMISIHLSDNRITKENEFYYDCLEEFQITEEDLIEINRSARTEIKTHPGLPKKYDKLDIDYKHYLDCYFDIGNNIDEHFDHGHSKYEMRKLYKDRMLLGKQ